MNENPPLVSIITATYNRSNVLRYSIQSVLDATLSDWEMLIIGDCCTDDTAEVVASFQDKRIQYINLERNIGEQSGPNNVGLDLAKGKYIAFLNHDDLWFPDHLKVCLFEIEKQKADLVFSLLAVVKADDSKIVLGASPTKQYEPYLFIPASSWFFRKSLVQEVGKWRFYKEIWTVPSEDWIFRAWKMKKKLCLVPRLTVLAIHSGLRKNVYAERTYQENEYYFHQLKNNPNFRENLLTELTYQQAADFATYFYKPVVLPLFKRICINLARALAIGLGLTPAMLRNFVLYRRKGVFIDMLRKRRGLKKI